MKPSEALFAAADLIAATSWTRGAYARTKQGLPVAYDHPGAASYCGLGAVNRTIVTAPDMPFAEIPRVRQACGAALRDAAGVGAEGNFAVWQDDAGRAEAEVLAVMRRAGETEQAAGR